MTDERNQQDVFGDMLIAGMLDAAIEQKITQLKTTITPEGRTKPVHVRIVIMPELMEHEWPGGLGKKT